MTRWPRRAILSLTPAPIAATTPHGSCPAMTGSGLTGSPPIAAPPDFDRRYWCRSLPHMPEAFISTTTSSGPGVGSGNSISSISRSPVKTTPRIGSSALFVAKPMARAYAFSPPPGTAVGAHRMSRIFGLFAGAFLCCAPIVAAADPPPWPGNLPKYGHILIVVEENKDYDQIIDNHDAQYINKLASEGASLTHMFAEEHHSEGNYFWLFSGSNQKVGFKDKIPSIKFVASNLGVQLINKQLSFK